MYFNFVTSFFADERNKGAVDNLEVNEKLMKERNMKSNYEKQNSALCSHGIR